MFRPGPRLPVRGRDRCSCTSGASRWKRTSRPFSSSTCPGAKWSSATDHSVQHAQAPLPEGALHRRQSTARSWRRTIGAPTVFVFPSRTDTFGLVLLEAMASGTPVAAYPVSGPIDVVTPGRSGVLDEDLRARGARRAGNSTATSSATKRSAYSWELATKQFLSEPASQSCDAPEALRARTRDVAGSPPDQRILLFAVRACDLPFVMRVRSGRRSRWRSC